MANPKPKTQMFRILTRTVILDWTIYFSVFHDIGMNFKSNKKESQTKIRSLQGKHSEKV